MSDGVRMIPVETPSGSFEVWTRKAGDNPRLRLLLLHGGPGATHEYLLPMEQDLVDAGVEVHFYDQLGSHLATSLTNRPCGRSTGSSTRWSRCAWHSGSAATTSCSTASPGAGCSASTTPSAS